MKKVLIILPFILFSFPFVFGQKKISFTIRAIYGIGFSRLNITNYEKIIGEPYLINLYKTEKPTRPLWGKRHGIEAQINFRKKYAIGAGYIQSSRTTRTSLFYAIVGTDTSQYSPLYEGAQLRLIYRSAEVPLYFRYNFTKKRFSGYAQFAVTGDFYWDFTSIEYLKRKDQENLDSGISLILYGVKNGLLRIGISPSIGVSYKIYKFLSIDLNLAYTYFSNGIRIHKCPFCPIFVAGNIHTLIPNLGIGFTF